MQSYPTWSWGRLRALGARLGAGDLIEPSAHHEALRELVAAAGIGPAERVAEIGCGGGRLLQLLRPVLPSRGARYLGICQPQVGLRAARQVAARSALTSYVAFVESDSQSATPLGSRSQDVIFLDFVLCSLSACDRRALLTDLRRALRPGGRLLVAEPSADYDPDAVVGASIERDRELRRLGAARRRFNQLGGYALLRRLEVDTAARLRDGFVHGYGEASLRAELEGAALAVDWVRGVGDSGVLIARARRAEDDASA